MTVFARSSRTAVIIFSLALAFCARAETGDDTPPAESADSLAAFALQEIATQYHGIWAASRKTVEANLDALRSSQEVQRSKPAQAVVADMQTRVDEYYRNLDKSLEQLLSQIRPTGARDLQAALAPSEADLMRRFLQSDLGTHFREAEGRHSEDLGHPNYPESERQMLAEVRAANLFERYNPIAKQIQQRLIDQGYEAQLKLAADFQRDLESITDRLEPQHVFSEPLESNQPIGFLTGPLSSVRGYMERHAMDSETIVLDSNDPNPRIGDRLTALVSYAIGDLEKQWLIRIESVEKTPAEATETSEPVRETWHTTRGGGYDFTSQRSAVTISITGPFDADDNSLRKDPPTKTSRTLLKTDFLRIGLHRYAETFCRIREIASTLEPSPSWNYNLGRDPFPDDVVERSRTSTKDFAITDEDDRAFAGSALPLWEFLEICNRTPDLRAIITKVVKLPSVASLFSNGFATRYQFVYGPWNRYHRLPEFAPPSAATLYSIPVTLTIYEKPSLYLRIFPTEPVPPLQLSSGFYGLVASTPDKPEKRLVVRILSTRRGLTPSESPPKPAPLSVAR